MFDEMRHGKEITQITCSWLMTGAIRNGYNQKYHFCCAVETSKGLIRAIYSYQYFLKCLLLFQPTGPNSPCLVQLLKGCCSWHWRNGTSVQGPSQQKPNCRRTYLPLIKWLSLPHLSISQKAVLWNSLLLTYSLSKNTFF